MNTNKRLDDYLFLVLILHAKGCKNILEGLRRKPNGAVEKSRRGSRDFRSPLYAKADWPLGRNQMACRGKVDRQRWKSIVGM